MREREAACFTLFAFDGAHVKLCMEKQASLDLPSPDLAAATAVSLLAVCRGRTASLGKLPQVGGGRRRREAWEKWTDEEAGKHYRRRRAGPRLKSERYPRILWRAE